MYRRLAAFATLIGLASAAAQKAEKLPPRPRLPAAADTNDARVYNDFGNLVIERNPQGAADAFYWATRIDPSLGEAFYGRRAALLVSDPHWLVHAHNGVKRVVQSDDMLRLDSLMSRALMLNPVLPLRHERLISFTILKQLVEDDYNEKLTLGDEAMLDMYFDRVVRNAFQAEGLKARMAQSDGDYDKALKFWALAVKHASKKAEYRAARGRLLLQLGKADSAIAEFTLALEELRKRDKKDFVVLYNSKAMLEMAAGIAHQRLDDAAAARVAYGRALEEDLAYYPAHARLGFLALDKSDTTAALTALDLAVQLRGDDGLLRDQYGFVLLAVGKHADAAAQFAKAVELEPYFALPRRHLGEALEKSGKPAEAAAAYRVFLALASRSDPQRTDIERRVETLAAR